MESQIQSFYKNKTVFISGGSGFLGRVIIEKLLRSTEIKRIFVLIRPKKDVSGKDRIAAWNTDPVFSVLLKSNPNYSDRVVAIAGDCGFPDLGISVEDRKVLVDAVQIVIHCAATVRFDERLNVALDINTRGTLLIVQLAKEMRSLEAFVHVSTAFSSCVIHHINEAFYPEKLTCSFDKILALKEILNNDLIDEMTPTFLEKFPNTYTFTKALAEQVVQKEASDLPACVIRPGIVLAAFKEPLEGWMDNLYGPIFVAYAWMIGVLRVTFLDKHVQTHIVPVDYCANLVLSAAWKTAMENVLRKQNVADQLQISDPTIYNFVSGDKNPLNWRKFSNKIEAQVPFCPLEQMKWYPVFKTYNKQWAFRLAALVYHIVPGHVIDIVLRLKGQKPRMIKIYNKIHENIMKVAFFANNNWTFDMHNSDQLIQCMSSQDRKLFECDINGLSWDEYLKVLLLGVREYIAKEKPTEESIRKAQKKMKQLHLYHRIVQTVVAGAVILLLLLLLTRGLRPSALLVPAPGSLCSHN